MSDHWGANMEKPRIRPVTFVVTMLWSIGTAAAATQAQYFAAGEDTLRILGGPLASGCTSLEVSRAEIEGVVVVDQFGYLGSTRDEVLTVSGRDINLVEEWKALSPTVYCNYADGQMIRQQVGEHVVEWRLPRALWGPNPNLQVMINGQAAGTVSFSMLLDATNSSLSLSQLLEQIPSGISHVVDVSVLDELGIPEDGEPSLVPMSDHAANRCWPQCLMCGVSITAMLGAVGVAIPMACNPGVLLVSGGVGCYYAVGSVGLAVAASIGECVQCGDCLQPAPPPSGTGSGCQDPSGCCPHGYHECCNNNCCSDLDPPPSCDQSIQPIGGARFENAEFRNE